MASLVHAKALYNKLSQLERKALADSGHSVVVGYTAAYALPVHENIEMKLKGQPRPKGRGRYWDPQGRAQAKFLEQPARELGPELGRIVGQAVKKGLPLIVGLQLAGLRLQRASQRLVPVDTGNLKNSAFTRIE